MRGIFDNDSRAAAASSCAGAALGGADAPAEPSIHGPFPARVKGADARGGRFKVSTVLEKLSAGYCRVRLEGRAVPGASLFVATRVIRAVVVLRGTVINVLPLADGASSALVRIRRYRFVRRQTDQH